MTTKSHATSVPFPRNVSITLRRRVRPHMLAVLQTAAAALAAWFLADALLPTDQPTFASIAAVICLGITHGQRRRRALELIAGVLLGITIASVLVFVIGTGPLQIALLVVLAMTAALLFRGGELLVNEAAISAILLASLQTTTSGFSADRILEGLIGGAVALTVAAFLLPPDPLTMVGPAAQTLFGRLGRTLEDTATALEHGDIVLADEALADARGMDDLVVALEDVLAVASETARFSPARRGGIGVLRRYQETMPQLDYAVRNTRVLVRNVARHVRTNAPAPHLASAIKELASAVWVLAALYEQPERDDGLRGVALEAARLAEGVHEREPALLTTQIVGQIRSVAVDLVRAADALTDAPEASTYEMPTEELLAAAPG